MLLAEDEGGASVSSFLLFADVFASFALCMITCRLFASTAPESTGCSRLAGVRRLDRWAGNSDGGDKSG